MFKEIRWPRLAGATILILLAIVATALLGDYYLHGPWLFWPVYLAEAFACTWGCYLLAVLIWTCGRPVPPFGGSILARLGVHIAIVAVSVVSIYAVPNIGEELTFRLHHEDPIGVGDDVARGPCRTRQVATVPNRRGLVAEVRETYCYGNWDGDLMYFVFLHSPGLPNTKQNLVFRYVADTLPDTKPPVISWTAPHRL